jgi:hypothetical protein
MNLIDLIDNSRTDKNTVHSYINLYQELLSKKRTTAKNVLEIGIGVPTPDITDGGSIKLWHDFFTNAIVYALDIKNIEEVWEGIKNNNRII